MRRARRAFLSLRAGAAILASLPALLALACGPEAEPEPLPGLELLARVESRLERDRDRLRANPVHYGEVFEVEQPDLHAFFRQVVPHGAGADLTLGTARQPESHGGGLLRLLLDHWRPEGRAAALGDRYPFAGGRRPLALGALFEAHRQQLFLPVPGSEAEAIDGALPASAVLPRTFLHFRDPFGGTRPVDSDAYKMLGLLLREEPDPSRVWSNRFGQRLSLALLMRHVRDHYLASAAPRAEPADHSELHLVELLVAYDGSSGEAGLASVQRHFLDTELAQREVDARDAALVRAHFAESLGLLVAAPGLTWSDADRRRVHGWLAELEDDHFADVEAVDLVPLTHLAKGLRAVRAHRDALE